MGRDNDSRSLMRHARSLAPAFAFALALGGCLGLSVSARGAPYVPSLSVAPGGSASFALFVANDGPVKRTFELEAAVAPSGWEVALENSTVALAAHGAGALLVTVHAPRDATYGPTSVTVRVAGASVPVAVDVRDHTGEWARPGVGAKVWTAGFWDNGTVFYTNMPEVRDNHDVPSFDLSPGETKSYVPLKVYVGGTRGTHPPEPYNRSGYVPVIKGFDRALDGLRAGDAKAVRIAPADAYTQPGNEKHPLYGDALNFVVVVESVDVLPPDDRPILPIPTPP